MRKTTKMEENKEEFKRTIQTTTQGCGLYVLTNTFNHPFIDDLNEDNGALNTRQLEKELQKKYYDLYLVDLARKTQFTAPLKYSALDVLTWIQRKEELTNDEFVALILTVLNRGKSHYIGCYVDKESIIIDDPVNKRVKKFSLKYDASQFLTNRKNYLYGITCYAVLDEELNEKMLHFRKNKFEHIKF